MATLKSDGAQGGTPGGRLVSDEYNRGRAQKENVFDPRTVEKIHQNADTDKDRLAVHHTLGPGPNQSAPGAHTHDGATSPLLLEGTTLTGSRGGNAALPSIIAALVKLGAVDSTTV